MGRPDYGTLVEWLRETFGDALRWTASFDSDSFSYDVRYVRQDLKTELTEQQLDVVIHRSMAVYNRRHLEDVYSHLGPAESLVVQHERATAIHVYVGTSRGVVVKLSADTSVTVPAFVQTVRQKLGLDDTTT